MRQFEKVKKIIDNFKKQEQRDYGIAIFEVYFREVGKRFFLSGKVLTKNQKSEIIELFKKEKIKIIKCNIKILSDEEERLEIGWVVVKNKVIDLKSRFVSDKIINEKILKRIRCSQAFKGEILRLLSQNENQLLVQQNDLTLGWVNRKDVVLKKKSLLREWRRGNFAIKGKVIFAKRLHNSIGTMEPALELSNTIKEAEKYLGAKYVLGGKSKKGIDCSGLVQVVYKNSLNIILPKHSWDQKEMGEKVKLEDVKTGDLIFLIKKENSHKHVGIVEKNKDINLIHASLEKKKVIRQSLEKVFESYDFVEAKRVVE